MKFRKENRTVMVQKERAIYECCEGYYENETKTGCVAHCTRPCTHGKCVSPEVCKCDEGYGGPSCDISMFITIYDGSREKLIDFIFSFTACPPNFYGKKCNKKCSCSNDATCDPFDGTCQCKKGFQGKRCEKTCEPDHYGENCAEECRCHNEGKCHHISGECFCPDGWAGAL